MSVGANVYGLLAEFDDGDSLVAATGRMHEAGYRRLEAYSPYPLDELPDALGYGRTWMAPAVFAGGVIGGLGAFFMQYFATVIHYPLNVGGRPLNSWPVYIPVTFEMTVLLGALFGATALVLLSRLPMPYHPLFNVREFDRASQDKFFLCIETADPKFDHTETGRLLQEFKARRIVEVPR